MDEELVLLFEGPLGTREFAGELELIRNKGVFKMCIPVVVGIRNPLQPQGHKLFEMGVEFPVVVGVFTIGIAGLNIAMLATGLVTVIDPPLVLARLVIEPSLVFETMVSFQEINLPASPPAVSEMLSVQVPLAFLSFNTESGDSGRKDPIKGQVALPIAVVA